jgi:hypothetical protein
MNLRLYPGWLGVHTREQAPGAMPNGTRVRKVALDPGDAHPIGALATILGSVQHAQHGPCYFVEWDAKPRAAVFVAGFKIASERVN